MWLSDQQKAILDAFVVLDCVIIRGQSYRPWWAAWRETSSVFSIISSKGKGILLAERGVCFTIVNEGYMVSDAEDAIAAYGLFLK